ncbi:MAG: hypothetical protein GY841_16040 [FCB group bacterium]|nr:hypothetical protein [FCB group bacterium]
MPILLLASYWEPEEERVKSGVRRLAQNNDANWMQHVGTRLYPQDDEEILELIQIICYSGILDN